MSNFHRHFVGLALGVCALLAGVGSATCSDLFEPPVAPASRWQFSFTPYGWMTGIYGDATARGHSVEIDADFFDIVEKSNSLMALMAYFEARKGRFGFFTDVVWEDLTLDGQRKFALSRNVSRNQFARFPNINAILSANLALSGRAEVDYSSTIVQSGAAFEIANRSGPTSHTALDVLGGARYWNQEVDVTLDIASGLVIDAEIERDFQRLGLDFRRSRSRAGERTIVAARSGKLEWVDPFVGARIRHRLASGSELAIEGDVGGFGVGSEFSWQAVGTYGFDVNCFGTPLRTVVGYRALAVDYSENGRYGKNALDFVQHGPVMGVSLRW